MGSMFEYKSEHRDKSETPKTSKYDRLCCCMDDYAVVDNEQSTSETEQFKTPKMINDVKIISVQHQPFVVSRQQASDRKTDTNTNIIIKKEAKLNITNNNFTSIQSIYPNESKKNSDLKNNVTPSVHDSDASNMKTYRNKYSDNSNDIHNEKKISHTIKILLVGNPKSGKTCFKNILTDRYVKHSYIPTEKINCETATHIYRNMQNIIHFYDTPGNVECISNIQDVSDFDCVIFFYRYGTTLKSLEQFDKSIFASSENILKLYVCNGHFTEFCQTGSYYMIDLTKMNHCVELLKDIAKILNYEYFAKI